MNRVRRAGLAILRSRLVCALLGKACVCCSRKTLATVGWGPVLSPRGLHVPLCHVCQQERESSK